MDQFALSIISTWECAIPHIIRGYTKSCGCLRCTNSFIYNDIIKNKILKHVKINEKGCWEWQKSKHKQGYGHCGFKGKVMLAHRVSWMVFKGEIPVSILVLHKCDNPTCVNPDHLFLGTDKDNVQDSILKNRFNRSKGEKHYLANHSEEKVQLAKNLKSKGLKYKEISKLTGIPVGSLSGIINSTAWKHVK